MIEEVVERARGGSEIRSRRILDVGAEVLGQAIPLRGEDMKRLVAIVICVAGLASYFPASRATRVDPLASMRSE